MGRNLQELIVFSEEFYDLFDFHAKTNDNILTTDRVGYITRQFFTLIEGGRPKTHRDVAHYAAQLNVTSILWLTVARQFSVQPPPRTL